MNRAFHFRYSMLIVCSRRRPCRATRRTHVASMDLDGAKTPKTRQGLSAESRAARRERIFARLRDGWALDAIAREETLSAERVRQIVEEIVKGRRVEEGSTTARLRIARLAPAIQTAGEALRRDAESRANVLATP